MWPTSLAKTYKKAIFQQKENPAISKRGFLILGHFSFNREFHFIGFSLKHQNLFEFGHSKWFDISRLIFAKG
jgi:hypothetical protein